MLGDEVETTQTIIEIGALCPVCCTGAIEDDLQCEHCGTEFCSHCGKVVKSSNVVAARRFPRCKCDADDESEEDEE